MPRALRPLGQALASWPAHSGWLAAHQHPRVPRSLVPPCPTQDAKKDLLKVGGFTSLAVAAQSAYCANENQIKPEVRRTASTT